MVRGRLSPWKRLEPVNSSRAFGEFLSARAAFIAQKTLYGYVKTRMGMKYPAMFEDDIFIESLNIGKWQIYAACLSDLSIFMAAQVYARTGDAQEAASIAEKFYSHAIIERFQDAEFTGDTAPLIDAFKDRLVLVDWNYAMAAEGAFKESPRALIRWAPIDDELKKFDIEIVTNSIRFQWQRVRSDFLKAFDVDAFLADWNRTKA
ncbi:hypothetical protein [Salaquimonas pukyongi]|uniref:hypothetical protein n=1 Tax=Salaquimonas pukyongi TaxID=2712698 RepID=UPI00096B8488|nr:hypothetical protein [Salaquimonas pukyongi]